MYYIGLVPPRHRRPRDIVMRDVIDVGDEMPGTLVLFAIKVLANDSDS